MMALFDLKVWMGIAIAGLVAMVGLQQVRVSAAKANVARAEKNLSDYKLAVSETTRILQADTDRKRAEQLTRERDAADAARTREARLRDDAAGAQSELDRLRLAIRSTTRRDPVPGAVPSANPEHASAEGELFLECAAAFTGMAQAAGGHASDVQTLTESWPKR